MKQILTFLFCLFSIFGQNQTMKFTLPLETEQEVFNELENEDFLFEMGWQLIISFETYKKNRYWDHGHYSDGWGTLSKSSSIDLPTANKRSRSYYAKRIKYIKRKYPHLSLFQQYLLAAVEYNLTHDRWKSELVKKVKSGHSENIVTSLKYYFNASGEVQGGLVIRRNVECLYLLAENDIEALEQLITDTKIRILEKNGHFIYDQLEL